MDKPLLRQNKEAQGMLRDVRGLKQVAVSGETSRNIESCIVGKQVGQLAGVQGLLLPPSFYEKVAGPQVVKE